MTHTRFGIEYVEWSPGILVTKADFAALENDRRMTGNAFVEQIGGYGRRIAPENMCIRTADKVEPKNNQESDRPDMPPFIQEKIAKAFPTDDGSIGLLVTAAEDLTVGQCLDRDVIHDGKCLKVIDAWFGSDFEKRDVMKKGDKFYIKCK